MRVPIRCCNYVCILCVVRDIGLFTNKTTKIIPIDKDIKHLQNTSLHIAKCESQYRK